MIGRTFHLLAVCLALHAPCAAAGQTTGAQDREYWVQTLDKIAAPVLENMARGELRLNMPVETTPGKTTSTNHITTHLEAIGRLLAGIGPWLELGPDDTPEGKLREKYIDLAVRSIRSGFDPASPDYLNFTVRRQPLVDAAFLCQGLLRAPTQVWGRLDAQTRARFVTEMDNVRRIVPLESNWLLFAATVEAALLDLTGQWNPEPVDYALKRFGEWYKGDGWYGDGPELHMDYYNSYVIHPMMMDVLRTIRRHGYGEQALWDSETVRFRRHAAQLERFISPDGAYPVVGRSIVYRFGAFQVLSQAALLELLPAEVAPAQARCAMTAVIRRHMAVPGNFDDNGWLTLGFAGHQPEMAEGYISTGSLYLAAVVFPALGLSPQSDFWSGPFTPWSGFRAWSGDPTVKQDKALKE